MVSKIKRVIEILNDLIADVSCSAYSAQQADCAIAMLREISTQQEPEPEQMVTVTREMAIDAGDPSMEGARVLW